MTHYNLRDNGLNEIHIRVATRAKIKEGSSSLAITWNCSYRRGVERNIFIFDIMKSYAIVMEFFQGLLTYLGWEMKIDDKRCNKH